jgi:CubicO group peptidase (beta-lactamase class C family)
MKKATLLCLAALLFLASFAQQKDARQLTAAFDKILSEQFPANGPGATAIVSRKGQVLYHKALGKANMELNIPMQASNVFRIGSITKQFTAVAILQLAEQGKLNLQDEITKYFPDYPTQGNKITIEHLLTHTSGIRNYTSIKDYDKKLMQDMTPAEMVDYFKNQPMRFAPGTRWEYSNSGYFLLGQIIEKVSGKTYPDYLEEVFFKPLGMANSSYASDKKIIANRADGYTTGSKGIENAPYISMTQPYAAGSILSTVEDLYKWNSAVKSNKLLKKESLEKALTRYKLADGKETAYGYGWRMGYIQESPMIWHGGLITGFFSMAMYLPKEDVFVAVLSNCDCKSPEDVTAKLAAAAIGKPYDYKPLAMSDAALQSFAGVYENERGQQRVLTVSGTELKAQAGRGRKSTLHAYQKDRFYFDEDIMQSIQFGRNKEGDVDRLTVQNRVGNEVWKKTDKPIPSEDGVKLDEKILESYVGEYEVTPNFNFSVTREQDKLFLQAKGQEKLQLFAEAEGKFFLKVNDAQLQFVQDASGKVTKAILNQGGRATEAVRTK